MFVEVIVDIHEVSTVWLDRNTGKCQMGGAICDVLDGESYAVCWCCAQTH